MSLGDPNPRKVVRFASCQKLVSRRDFHDLFHSDLSHSELCVLFYLIDLCNEWGFTTHDNKSIARFFKCDFSNMSKKIKNLKRFNVIKSVTYNGRSGFMVNPIYCYQGNMKLKRFRNKLWLEEVVHTKRKGKFYGPPVENEQVWRNRAIIRNKHGNFSYVKRIDPDPYLEHFL